MQGIMPKIKTVRIMFQGLAPQQEAVFRMAFKMHNTTHYQIVSPESGEEPDMVLVDTDTQTGQSQWEHLKTRYPDIPVVVFSAERPTVRAPYLAKPVKFDTLFPVLRTLAQGGGIVETEEALQQKEAENSVVKETQAPQQATIHRFNPNKGLLGALKFAGQGHQDIAVLHEGKAILIVFPGIQRVLLAVSTEELEKLCRDDRLTVVCKVVPDNPEWKSKAKVTISSCLWQMAIWTAQGRLIYPMTPQTVFTLKRWPNLTRLAPVPESMRLSAFLTKTSVNLNILYKVMPLSLPDILNYLAATSVTGFLATDSDYNADQAQNMPTGQMNVDSNVPNNTMARDAEKIAGPSEAQPRGLLQRLMRKLLGKN